MRLSKIRNKALAHAFLYMNLIEEWGTGIPKLIQEMQERNLREPEFIDMESAFRVNLYRPAMGGQLKDKFVIEPVESQSEPVEPDNATLKPEDATLKPENATLKPENATLKPENATLKPNVPNSQERLQKRGHLKISVVPIATSAKNPCTPKEEKWQVLYPMDL